MSAGRGPVILAVSIGCPSGIGPEVSVVAASKVRGARSVLVGDRGVIERAASLRRVPVKRLVDVTSERDAQALGTGEIGVYAQSTKLRKLPSYGAPDPAAGAAQLAWIDQATDLVTSGFAHALVTGPVSKHAIATSEAPGSEGFLGHTEHLAARLRAKEVVMAFHAPELTIALVTTHLPIAHVPSSITIEGVERGAYHLARLLFATSAKVPSVAVLALNPHAGEGGLLGREEEQVIAPGIERARKRLALEGIDAALHGPIGAETGIRHALRRRGAAGRYDGALAMYHDQATIPSKLLAFGDAVNVTLGLPIVRTSVDHGTGYDIAGLGEADARGMRAAMMLAVTLARTTGGRA